MSRTDRAALSLEPVNTAQPWIIFNELVNALNDGLLIRWLPSYVALDTVFKGDLVYQSGWLLIANKDTSQAAAGGASDWDTLAQGVISGSGSPEGVVAAPVGALYSRSDGGPGAILHVKELSAGDTGWASANTFDLKKMQLVFTTTTASESITIPCQNVGTFNAVIDWGDSSTSAITAWNDAGLTHTYANAGDHTVTISGTFPNIYFNNGGDKLKLKEVKNLGATGLTGLNNAFYGCSNLTSVNGYADISLVTSMGQAFRACSSLTAVDASGWDTSSVNNMWRTFNTCTNLATLDVSGWDVSAVTSMTLMFSDCTSLAALDVSGWDVSAVITLFATFQRCTSLAALDVSGWDTSSATSMGNMFSNVNLDLAVDGWNIEAVTEFTSFMLGVTLPTSRYDATLIAWDAQNPVDSLTVNFGNSKYTGGGAAEAARANLVATDLWTIQDGGIAP